MAHQGDGEPSVYEEIGDRLKKEFVGVHPPETVTRCVAAARYGAQEVTGAAAPGLVEKIARKHLQVLAMVAAEKQRAERRRAERREAERREADRADGHEPGQGTGHDTEARHDADGAAAGDARGRHRVERRPDGRAMPPPDDGEERRRDDRRADLPHTPRSATGNAP
ncbi:hypothetical protein GCM10022214_81190 [Actinomadura miaoliensis]|uniref:Uncharacterized protein n=1 Tax=Actinomadura miaoliensis TaxID=430685 RepID=A0ABP7X279_9ACTN